MRATTADGQVEWNIEMHGNEPSKQETNKQTNKLTNTGKSNDYMPGTVAHKVYRHAESNSWWRWWVFFWGGDEE